MFKQQSEIKQYISYYNNFIVLDSANLYHIKMYTCILLYKKTDEHIVHRFQENYYLIN